MVQTFNSQVLIKNLPLIVQTFNFQVTIIIVFCDANKYFAEISGQILLKNLKKGQILSDDYAIIFYRYPVYREQYGNRQIKENYSE